MHETQYTLISLFLFTSCYDYFIQTSIMIFTFKGGMNREAIKCTDRDKLREVMVWEMR